MNDLPNNYSENIEEIINKSKIDFEMIKYSETKRIGNEVYGYFNLLKSKKVGGIYVNINKKEGKIKFGEPIMMEDLNLKERLELNGLEEKISKELDFITIKVEVPEEEIKKELIKEGYLFENKGHLGIKKLK
ncbi:hypothetical protein CO037_01655 [Candidatus Pacearchaeota archaeon CG_4_9_14_0_2_um_filter_30_8]|nr:MAG: hypothetical protein CO037_01655 [Candidatus Pacearchaeota archaeon CG_4_9_14_0_2_um_filter_30_8]